MEKKTALLDQVKVLSEAEGIVEAYTNTMGEVDLDRDIIEPTAFDNSIDDNLPIPALVGHDVNSVVGKVIAPRKTLDNSTLTPNQAEMLLVMLKVDLFGSGPLGSISL